MANNLASTIFSTGARNSMAAIDVYQAKNVQNINSIQDVLKQQDPNLKRAMAGMSQGQIQSLTNAVLSKGKLSPTVQNLMSRALSASPQFANSIRSIDSSLRETIQGKMGSMVPGGLNAINNPIGAISTGAKSLINGQFSNILPENVVDTGNMCKFVGASTGSQESFKIFDPGATAGLYSSIIETSRGLGLGNITNVVLETVTDRQVLGMVAQSVMPSMVKGGSISDIMFLARTLSSGSILASFPTLLNTFTRMFGSDNQHLSAYPNPITTFPQLIQMYDTAQPGWNHYVRQTENGPENCICISPLIGGSPRFNTILTSGAAASSDPNIKTYAAAAFASPLGVEEQIAKQYPKTSFKFNKTVRPVSDPRLLNRI